MKDLLSLAIANHPTGSRYICNPAPTDTDDDTVVLWEEGTLNKAIDVYLDAGWKMGGSYIPGNKWQSFKLNELNHIVTDNLEYYQKFITATNVAKRLNLLKKEDRVVLFDCIVHGNPYY